MHETVCLLDTLISLSERDQDELIQVLQDCVAGGASVSFMHPLHTASAKGYWQQVSDEAQRGQRVVLVARLNGRILGTVQLVLAQPENQPHRADVSKLLVHRDGRRRGLGAALMRQIEVVAREKGKTLLVLDTASDEARRLYERLGWQHCGSIPGFALWPHGGLCDTTFYYKTVQP